MHALCKKSTPCVQRPSHVLSETPRTLCRPDRARPPTFGQAASSGFHAACLDVPGGADFDAALQRFNGMRWVTVARTRGDSGDETVTFTGRFGIYRYLVTAVSGSGDYTLGYKRP